jgi:hypothetical protein
VEVYTFYLYSLIEYPQNVKVMADKVRFQQFLCSASEQCHDLILIVVFHFRCYCLSNFYVSLAFVFKLIIIVVCSFRGLALSGILVPMSALCRPKISFLALG